jgi:hypothetical protein
MENFVILAAVAVTLIVCVLMVGLFRAERRAPLRLPQEEAWADDEAGTVRKLTPPRASPIDREAVILDVQALDAKILDDRRALIADRSDPPEPDTAGRRRQIG